MTPFRLSGGPRVLPETFIVIGPEATSADFI
jgi:hypothetical protein